MDINTRIHIDNFDLNRAGLPKASTELTNWNDSILEYLKELSDESITAFIELVYKLGYSQGIEDILEEEE